MKQVAIVVNSRFGQTEKIAHRLRAGLLPYAERVHVFSVRSKKDARKLDIGGFDAIIIGAPVYAGKFSKGLIRWVKLNADELARKQTAFFSVSGNAGDPRKEARSEDDRLLRSFLQESGLRPAYVASFGGAIHFQKYNPILKFMMKRISEAVRGPVDTTRDIELTDWSQVASFATAFGRGAADIRFSTESRLGRLDRPAVQALEPAFHKR